ncbi:hypothetical protein PV797_05910 [Clostridiaceae bacterium M8S5]|nr:hypothetical protein PV797_05910 [Clostridiaceae bacterium M8S5]
MKRKTILMCFITLLLSFYFSSHRSAQDLNVDKPVPIKGYFCAYENSTVDLRINLDKTYSGSYSIRNLYHDNALFGFKTNLLYKNILQFMFREDIAGKYTYNSFITQINNDIYTFDTKNLTFDILGNKNNNSPTKHVELFPKKILQLEKAILEDDNYHALIKNVSDKTAYITDIIIGNDVFDKISIAYSKNGINYYYLNSKVAIFPDEKCLLRVNFLLNDDHGYFILKPYLKYTHDNKNYKKILEAESISF